MPTYAITAPDGKEYEIDGPPGATRQQVIAKITQQLTQQQAERSGQFHADPTQLIPGQRADIQPRPETNIGQDLYGAGEAALTALTGITGGTIGNIDRTVSQLVKEGLQGNIGTPEAGQRIEQAGIKGMQTYTYQPRTPAGQRQAQAVGEYGQNLMPLAMLGPELGVLGQTTKPGMLPLRVMSAERAANTTTKNLPNLVRNTTLRQAQEAGYVVPPSYAGAGVGSRLLEGISGKYKTGQLAGIKNQQTTNLLAKKSLDIPENIPLSPEILREIRQTAFNEGYAPVRSVGPIKTDKRFLTDLAKIESKYRGAERSFPGGVSSDIPDLIAPIRVKSFNSADAIDMVKILRDQSSSAFRQGDNAMGLASKEVARALENQIERSLQMSGKKLLPKYRQARQKIAKSHSVENALIESTGDVDATILSREFSKGVPLDKELKIIGKFGQAYRDVARVPRSGDANPLTIVDFGVGGFGAGALNPYLVALPAARVGARYGILSKPYQKRFIAPK